MSYLVDTNVFSEPARAKPDPLVVAWLRDHEPELYLSTITIGELRHGIESLPAGKRRTALQSWLTGLCRRMEGRILSFNTNTANVWGQLVASWDKKGTSVPSLDSQLAATVPPLSHRAKDPRTRNPFPHPSPSDPSRCPSPPRLPRIPSLRHRKFKLETKSKSCPQSSGFSVA